MSIRNGQFAIGMPSIQQQLLSLRQSPDICMRVAIIRANSKVGEMHNHTQYDEKHVGH